MTQFHTDDYIDFLSRVTPENMDQYQKEQAKCKLQLHVLYHIPNIHVVNVGDDSPVFEGLFEYCGLSAGGSMGKLSYFTTIQKADAITKKKRELLG